MKLQLLDQHLHGGLWDCVGVGEVLRDFFLVRGGAGGWRVLGVF